VPADLARAAGDAPPTATSRPHPGSTPARPAEAYRGAYGDALDVVLLLGIGIAVLGTAVVLVLVRPPSTTAEPCTHLDAVRSAGPAPAPGDDGCHECLRTGRPYRELRLCQTCGTWGAATAPPGGTPPRTTPAPGTRSCGRSSPGEDWYWCYPDERLFEVPGGSPAPSHR
jgi:hypothetical protein